MTAIIGAITTLADLHQQFSNFVDGGVVPNTNDVLYTSRTGWFNLGREDLANRWFWSFLKTSDTIDIDSGDAGPYPLPLDLTRPNALRYFKTQTGGVEYTDPYSTGSLKITRDFTTGGYQVTFAEAPTADDIADIDYYGNPAPMTAGADLILLDGPAVLFFGLYMHFFSQGNLARMGELRNEYENRVEEITRQEAINAPGSFTNMQNYEKARGITNQRQFYGGNTRRSS